MKPQLLMTLRWSSQRLRKFLAATLILSSIVVALDAQDQTATIMFYREPRFATGNSKPMLSCDGVELARIENGTYFQISVPAGPHHCTAESSKQPAIEVNVAPSQTAYVHVRFEPTLKDHPALANTTESEYDKQKARLKPLKEWVRNSLVGSIPTMTSQAEQVVESDTTPPVQDEPASAQTPSQADGQPTWLHPSDGEYRAAIVAAAPHKADKHEVKILYFTARPQAELTSTFEVRPPLACAIELATLARNRLNDPPSLEDVKTYCDGLLNVEVTHYSTELGIERPVVIEYGGQTLRAVENVFDKSPRVATYDAGLFNSDAVGYRYVDLHKFAPALAWNGVVMFVTADELGKQKTLPFDFGKLEKNEREFRAQIEKRATGG